MSLEEYGQMEDVEEQGVGVKVVGSRQLIRELLSKRNPISIDEIRDYALGAKKGYRLVGSFIPITANGRLSFERIEEELLNLTLVGDINIENGWVSRCEK